MKMTTYVPEGIQIYKVSECSKRRFESDHKEDWLCVQTKLPEVPYPFTTSISIASHKNGTVLSENYHIASEKGTLVLSGLYDNKQLKSGQNRFESGGSQRFTVVGASGMFAGMSGTTSIRFNTNGSRELLL